MTRINRELEQLASACGVMTAYEDVYRERQVVSADSLLAVLIAMGIDVRSLDRVPSALETQRLARLHQAIEPVLVAWDGELLEFDSTLPAQQVRSRRQGRLHGRPRRPWRRGRSAIGSLPVGRPPFAKLLQPVCHVSSTSDAASGFWLITT